MGRHGLGGGDFGEDFGFFVGFLLGVRALGLRQWGIFVAVLQGAAVLFGCSVQGDCIVA